MPKNLYHIDGYGKKELIASKVNDDDVRQKIYDYLHSACLKCNLYSWQQGEETWYDAGMLRAFFVTQEVKDA